MNVRQKLIAERIRDRIWRICEIVPPIKPEPQFWLESDCGPSYCHSCAIKARADEFGLGVPLRDSNRWHCETDLEEAFYDGIDGGRDLESDSTAACYSCGETLSYILTDYGVTEELGYYLESPLASVRAEDSYALDRLCLNIYEGSSRKILLEAAVVVNQAWQLVGQVHP
ncbi:MAG: hypothetical protein KGL44_12915 [Sphingomonadales bacterium]|nr:hypothetical protein [Sphingomonadales bacterium]